MGEVTGDVDMPSIELDCPPGGTRPDDLIVSVLKGTGLKPEKNPVKFFGCWSWQFDVPLDKWASDVVPVVRPRIVKLFRDGVIRYGSW